MYIISLSLSLPLPPSLSTSLLTPQTARPLNLVKHYTIGALIIRIGLFGETYDRIIVRNPKIV